jgi:hypothetical protein
VPEELPQVDLGRRGDWLDALVPLQKRGEVLEVQRAGHDSVSLGTIEKLTADTLALRTFDEQGTLGREPGAYRWRDVAVVTSGTDYIEVYKRFLKSGEAPLSSGELTKRARSVDLDARGSDVRGALEQAAKTGQYVRLHRVFDGPSGCVILRVGPELVLARGYSELVCDPLEVLRLRDIERVESGPSEHIKTYLLRRERRLPKGKPRVDIRSVSSVLASAGALVIIEREAEGDFFLGRLRRGGKHRSQVEYLAFEGGFQKPESIDHSDVTRIELDSDYLRVSVQSLEKQG